jgi:zinc transport system substrate-binding protein
VNLRPALKKWLRILLYVAILLPGLANAAPASVFVSVLPLQTFVEKVGGPHVAVQTMVRPGYNPATYEPTPKQIAALAQARVYFAVGVPFENSWLGRIRSANPEMEVVDTRSGIPPRPAAPVHDDDGGDGASVTPGGHHHAAMDPHTWTSPMLAKQMARNIRDTLIRHDPSHRHDFARNFEAFAAELDELDVEVRTLLKDVNARQFMVFHPAWGYFADAYGLTEIAIEHEGKEPGARTLTALIEQARRENVKVIFVQPQFGQQAARQVAHEIGGRVAVIDPLAADYADNLRRVARLIAGGAAL